MKTTNLAMTVVFIFILTNLPYLVDEFIRQQIVTKQQCNTPVCHALKVTSLACYLLLFLQFRRS